MTSRDDPLNDILLPASDLANKIKSGEVRGKPRDRLLAGAVLILLAERDTMRWLYQAALSQAESEVERAELFASELTPEAMDRVRGYLRLRNKTGVAE